MGLQDFGTGGRSAAADVERVRGAAADGGDFGFSLRDTLEPAGQSLERRAVHGRYEIGEAKGGGTVCAGAGGRRLHGKCAACRFAAAQRAVCVRARWRAADCGAWRAIEVDCAAFVCVEEREVGARIHAAGPRPAGVLGAEWLSRVRRSLERAAILRKLEDCALWSGRNSGLTKRAVLNALWHRASIDRAHLWDEFFQLDAPEVICKSDSVEFTRLPRRNAR